MPFLPSPLGFVPDLMAFPLAAAAEKNICLIKKKTLRPGDEASSWHKDNGGCWAVETTWNERKRRETSWGRDEMNSQGGVRHFLIILLCPSFCFFYQPNRFQLSSLLCSHMNPICGGNRTRTDTADRSLPHCFQPCKHMQTHFLVSRELSWVTAVSTSLETYLRDIWANRPATFWMTHPFYENALEFSENPVFSFFILEFFSGKFASHECFAVFNN